MNKTLDELTALIRSTKLSVDHSFLVWHHKLLEDGDELIPFQVLVQETVRELSNTSLSRLEPLAFEHLAKLARKLSEFASVLADEGTSDQEIWAAIPEQKKKIYYLCATELCKFVRVARRLVRS